MSVVAALREHYGLERRPVKVCEPYQMLGLTEDDPAEAMGIDTKGVFAPKTIFGFPLENWKPWRMPDGLEVQVPTNFNTSVDSNGDFLIFERETAVALANLERIYAAIGNNVEAVFTCGTHFGTQTSSFCSVETFRTLWLPYYKAMNDWIHQHTTWRVLKHSCGAVEKFINSFIEAGFDILNPVQCSAAGMDPELLKAKYGDRITFWGGGVDTQKTLPFGTPQQVRDQVLHRCEIFSRKGAFVFTTIHNVQARTPLRNFVAVLDAVREFNGAN